MCCSQFESINSHGNALRSYYHCVYCESKTEPKKKTMTRQKHVTLVRHRMIIDQIRLFCFNDLEKEHITNITFSNNKNEINYNNDYNSDNYKKLPTTTITNTLHSMPISNIRFTLLHPLVVFANRSSN